MQLYDTDTELRLIKTLTDSKLDENIRSGLLGRLTKDSFYYEPALEAFKRIDLIARKRYELVSKEALLADTSIDEDMRDILRSSLKKIKSVKNNKTLTELIVAANKFRKVRALHQISATTLEALDDTQVDVETLVDSITDIVAKMGASGVEEETFAHFGAMSNTDELIKSVLANKKLPRIPTGFSAYDKENGGFPTSGVVILASTTSGGKSTIGMNICTHMYLKESLSVCRISLEMGEEQETKRMSSHLARVPMERFAHGTLTSKDKKKVLKAWDKFQEHGKKNDITYTTFCPKGDYTIDEVFRILKPFGFDLIMVDYIGLLKGTNDSDQWLQLSNIAGAAKRFSRSTVDDTLVVLLAQLDEDSDKLRYSRGMKEHADVLWQWNYAKQEQQELRLLPVEVRKDRDGKRMQFSLNERYDIMSAFNIDDTPDEDEDEGEDGFSKKKKKKKKSNKGSIDVSGKKASKKKKKLVDDDDDDGDIDTYAVP